MKMYYLQFFVGIIFALRLFIIKSEQVEIEIRRFYRIENADSIILTVGGESVESVKIITQYPTSYVKDPKIQLFWIGSRVGIDFGIYEISPTAQNTAINLVLEEKEESSLLYQQFFEFENLVVMPISLEPRRPRNSQWWRILDIENKNWHIINDKTNLCLVSRGNGMQVGDLSAKNQTWIFNIEKKAGSFP